MAHRFKIALLLPAFLALTACPGGAMNVAVSSVSDAAAAPVLVFDSQWVRLFGPVTLPNGEVRPEVAPVPFVHIYRGLKLESGDEVIWEFTRQPGDMPCDEDNGPSRVIYGQVPDCYVEVTPAKPLEVGRAYSLGRGQKAFVWEATGARPISKGTYKKMTKPYRAKK